jgi:hypothetical protein
MARWSTPRKQMIRLVGVGLALAIAYLALPIALLHTAQGRSGQGWLFVIGAIALATAVVLGIIAYRARRGEPYVPPAGRFDAPAVPRVQSLNAVEWYPGVNSDEWDWSGRFPIAKSSPGSVQSEGSLARKVRQRS